MRKTVRAVALCVVIMLLLTACQAPNVTRNPENTKGIQGIGAEGSTSIPSVKVMPGSEESKPSVTDPKVIDPPETQEVVNSSEMPETPVLSEPSETPAATDPPETPAVTESPEPPAATELPEPPAATESPETPAVTESPEPPAAMETPDTPAATEPSVALDPVDVTETGAGEGYSYRALWGDPLFSALKLGDGREAPYTFSCTLLLKGKDEVEDLLSGIDVGEVISVWGSQEESSKKTVSRDEYFQAIRERYDEEFFAGKMLLLVKIRTPAIPYSGGEVSLAKDGGILRVITTLVSNRFALSDAMGIYCFYVEIDRSVLEGITEITVECRT